MKIALVLPFDITYPGGVSQQVIECAHRVEKRGHEATVIAPSSDKTRVPELERLVTIGSTIPVPVSSATVSRLSFSFWHLPALQRELQKGAYDIIHIHAPEGMLVGPAALHFAPQDAAVVTTYHSNNPRNVISRAYGAVARATGLVKLAERADVRIAVSDAARDSIRSYMPGGEYRIIPNGIDTERFSPAVQPLQEYRDGRTNILFVGRMGNQERRKGLEHLLAAFNQFSWKRDVRLIIVGPGSMDDEARNMYDAMDNRSIVLAGRASKEDLPRYYATADIFCSPATKGESFGMVLAEAMATGTAVVASDIPGHQSVVRDGSGMLVRPGDADALAEKLEHLITHAKERKAMGVRGRNVVLNEFSWEVVVPRILDSYHEALAARRAKGYVRRKTA